MLRSKRKKIPKIINKHPKKKNPFSKQRPKMQRINESVKEFS